MSETIPEGFCQCGCGGRTSIAKRNYAPLGHVKGQPVRFIIGHAGHVPRPLEDRLMAQRLITEEGCWEWTGSRQPSGYGRIGMAIAGGRRAPRMVHRIAYELFIGAVPEGMDLDHLCRNRACFNPDHLEPVSRRENARRGIKGILTTHCPQGHPYDEENTQIKANGHRGCRACNRERGRRLTRRAEGLDPSPGVQNPRPSGSPGL